MISSQKAYNHTKIHSIDGRFGFIKNMTLKAIFDELYELEQDYQYLKKRRTILKNQILPKRSKRDVIIKRLDFIAPRIDGGKFNEEKDEGCDCGRCRTCKNLYPTYWRINGKRLVRYDPLFDEFQKQYQKKAMFDRKVTTIFDIDDDEVSSSIKEHWWVEVDDNAFSFLDESIIRAFNEKYKFSRNAIIIQKQVRAWLDVPTYASGRLGFTCRKAKASFEKHLSRLV